MNPDFDSFHCGEESFFVSLNSTNATFLLNDSKLSHVVFDFEQPLILDAARNAIQVTCRVAQFAAFNTLYVVTNSNNFISILLNTGVLVTDFITVGNHNATTLVSWFNTDSLFASNGLQIYHDSLTQKFTISATTTTEFSFLSTSNSQTLLGFRKNENISSSDFSLTSPFPGVLLGERQIFISWLDIDTKNVSSLRMGQSNLISCVGIDPLSPAIFFSDGPPFLVRQNVVERIELKICDADGNLVDFQNCDFNLVLEFSLLREKPKRQISFFQSLTQNRDF